MKKERMTASSLAVFVIVFAFTRCDGEAIHQPTPEELLADRVSLARAEEVCATSIQCCEREGLQDPELCVQDLARQLGRSLGASIVAGEVEVDEALLAECDDWLEQERADCLWNSERPAACDGWLTRLQGEGEPCVSSYSCAENRMCTQGPWDDNQYYMCDTEHPSDCRCEGLPGMGEPCLSLCADGLRCAPDTHICRRTLFIDEYCDPSESGFPCGEEAFCDHETSSCAPVRGLGETCGESLQCESHHCDESTWTCEHAPICTCIPWNG